MLTFVSTTVNNNNNRSHFLQDVAEVLPLLTANKTGQLRKVPQNLLHDLPQNQNHVLDPPLQLVQGLVPVRKVHPVRNLNQSLDRDQNQSQDQNRGPDRNRNLVQGR